MRQMVNNECPECDEFVPLLARSCSGCGAFNPARGIAMTAAAGVTLVAVASLASLYVAIRPLERASAPVTQAAPSVAQATLTAEPAPPPVGREAAVQPAPPPAGEQRPLSALGQGTPVARPAATQGGDFAWLTAAMAACDKRAADDPRKLHFLVIPLQANEQDIPDWRLLALGGVGNGITLRTDDALGGLRRGTLRVDSGQMAFAVQDAVTRMIYQWSPAAGPTSFATPDAAALRLFRLQLAPLGKADQARWGDVYERQNASCHWIAAIIRD